MIIRDQTIDVTIITRGQEYLERYLVVHEHDISIVPTVKLDNNST